MTKEQYEAKYQSNIKFVGYGIETETVMPCPACAEPDFVKLPVLDTWRYFKDGVVCLHCRRGFKPLVHQEPGVTKFEIVQTEGPDLPDYLSYMRREK